MRLYTPSDQAPPARGPEPADADQVRTILFARGIAILLIVGLHVHVVCERYGLTAAPYWYIVRAFFFVPIPALFFLFGVSMGRPVGPLASSFVVGRLLAYGYLYVVWSIALACVDALVGSEVKVGPWEILTGKSIYWFLYAVIGFIIVSFATRRLPLWLQISAAALISVVAPLFLERSHVADIAYNYIFFWAGFTFRKEILQWISRISRFDLCMSVGAYTSLLAIAKLTSSWSYGSGLGPLFSGMGTYALLSVSFHLSDTRAFAPILTVGRYLLPIYVQHFLVLLVTSRLYIGADLPKSAHVRIVLPWVLLLICVAGSIWLFRTLRKVPLYNPPTSWLAWARRLAQKG